MHKLEITWKQFTIFYTYGLLTLWPGRQFMQIQSAVWFCLATKMNLLVTVFYVLFNFRVSSIEGFCRRLCEAVKDGGDTCAFEAFKAEGYTCTFLILCHACSCDHHHNEGPVSDRLSLMFSSLSTITFWLVIVFYSIEEWSIVS